MVITLLTIFRHSIFVWILNCVLHCMICLLWHLITGLNLNPISVLINLNWNMGTFWVETIFISSPFNSDDLTIWSGVAVLTLLDNDCLLFIIIVWVRYVFQVTGFIGLDTVGGFKTEIKNFVYY